MADAPGSSGLPWLAEIDELLSALRALGVHAGVDESVPTVALELAYTVVGAAERQALSAEQHARAAGATIVDIAPITGNVLDGAACRSDLEALSLIEWRITRTAQALQLVNLTGPRGDVDPLGRTILLTTAALAGLLTAAVTMRNPHRPADATSASARALRAAIQALDEAAADAHGHHVTADLLDLTD